MDGTVSVRVLVNVECQGALHGYQPGDKLLQVLRFGVWLPSPADVRRQISGSDTATAARARAIDAVYTRTAHWFPEYSDRNWPIEQWVHDQTLIAAKLVRPTAEHRAERGRPQKALHRAQSLPIASSAPR
jgi:hypothetical protein